MDDRAWGETLQSWKAMHRECGGLLTASPDSSYFVKLKFVDVPNPFHKSTHPNLRSIDEETAMRELSELKLLPLQGQND